MKNFTVEHKYCGAIRTIEGYDIYDAMKKANLPRSYWKQI
jgi:hypothetical protein